MGKFTIRNLKYPDFKWQYFISSYHAYIVQKFVSNLNVKNVQKCRS